MALLSSHIEATLLRQNTTWMDVEQLLTEASGLDCYGVCVPPYYVKQAARFLKEKKATQKLITVIGFPMGYSAVSAKVEEIKKAVMEGAHELDVVVNLSAFLSGDMPVLKNDIQSVVTACHLQNKKVKLIIESGLLGNDDMLRLADLCVEADADFIKTSTGYAPVGAELEKVTILRRHLPKRTQIKASGGIKTTEQAKAFIEAGASRIGTSSAMAILNREHEA